MEEIFVQFSVLFICTKQGHNVDSYCSGSARKNKPIPTIRSRHMSATQCKPDYELTLAFGEILEASGQVRLFSVHGAGIDQIHRRQSLSLTLVRKHCCF